MSLLAQSRLLAGASAASGELLKRKPTADELAAVAVSGAQQIRSAPPSPGGSSRGESFEFSTDKLLKVNSEFLK